MIFDPMYFLIIAPAVLLGIWAQLRVKTTYAAARRMPAPLSGAAAARHILDSAGLQQIDIEQVPGHLSDHYDPRHKVLRLSQEVYQSRSLAAVGIAAHEAGHAIQDKVGYAPLRFRSAWVPMAGIGSNLGLILFIVGLMISPAFALAGIVLFSFVVLFTLITLPVEFDASARAKKLAFEYGLVTRQEQEGVSKVLHAAALTYVAAAASSILTLLYFLMRAGLLGGRNDREVRRSSRSAYPVRSADRPPGFRRTGCYVE